MRFTFLRLVGALVVCGALGAGLLLPFVGGTGLAVKSVADSFLTASCDVVPTTASQTTTVLASDGTTVIAKLFDQNRENIGLSQVPAAVQAALISTEDRRFYSDHGVDLRGVVRAALDDTSGSSTQGASTLTEQYVKQVRYFQATTPAARAAAVAQTVSRKIKDAKCAVELEKKYTKAQILDDYFNIAFFGENSYGIQVAARTYFGIPAAKLSVAQGALLVGLLQSPSDYDPFVHPDAARTRRNEVLANMVATGDLTAARAKVDEATPLDLASSTAPRVEEGCAYADVAVANAGFFCDYLVNWLEGPGGLTHDQLFTGGLTVVSTLDASLQNSGQKKVWAAGLKATSKTALVMPSVDPRTGAVQTMITSRHYGLDTAIGQTTLPLFTTAYAGSGSTYKFFTAIAALKLGVTPDYTLTTGSTAYTVRNCPTDGGQPYTTHNAGTYNATLPLRLALPESVNTYFVGMEDQLFGCDLTPIVNTALSLGMTALNAKDSTDPSQTVAQAVISQHRTTFTLGVDSTSALQLAGAYAAVANDGVFCQPTPVVSITDSAGKPVQYTRSTCTREMDVQVARTMVNMMTADTTSSYGTAGEYFGSWYADGGSQVASKTGTNNDLGNGNSALWFVGVTPTLVSASALVNPSSPTSTVSGLPADVSNNGSDVFGAYAATFWLDAYGSDLSAQQWTWPTVQDIDGAVEVPDITGQTPSDAASTLEQNGFTLGSSSAACDSPQIPGTVGYYEPQTAVPGTAITVCVTGS